MFGSLIKSPWKWLIILVVVILLFKYFTSTNHVIVNNPPRGNHIVAFGDSLTYGTGAAPGKDYPSQLGRMLGLPIINAGIPGDTTSSALERIDEVLDHHPDLVLITLGGNDLLQKTGKKQLFRQLETIIRRLQSNGALVIIGGIQLPLFGSNISKGYVDLARQTGAVLVPNIYAGILGHRDLMSDSVHPNALGYTIMARHFAKALRPYLQKNR